MQKKTTAKEALRLLEKERQRREYLRRREQVLTERHEAERSALAARYELYRKDPLLWLTERMDEDPKAFKWSDYGETYQQHTWDGDKDPLYNAWKDVAERTWVGIEAATGVAKTYMLARVVLWFLDCFENSLVVTSAPKEAQLELHLWAEINLIFHKFRKLRPFSQLNKLNLIVDNRKVSKSFDQQTLAESWQAVGFVSGVGAAEESATKARGFHRKDMLIVLEETSGMSNAVLEAFKNTCVGENNIIFAVGNPNHESDPLHLFCQAGIANTYRISSLDYPNVVLKRTIVPAAATLQSIEQRRKDYGEDGSLYLKMVRGIASEQADDSLIQADWVDSCYKVKRKRDDTLAALGVDVANSEAGDKAALAWGDGNYLLELHEFRCPDASHLAYNIVFTDEDMQKYQQTVNERQRRSHKPNIEFPKVHDYRTAKIADFGVTADCIGVDSVGVGASTIQTLWNLGYKAVALQGGQWEEAITLDDHRQPLYSFTSLRAQMYWELREDLRNGNISIWIPKNLFKKLRAQLLIPKFQIKGNRISVESKAEIIKRMLRESPNMADAVVYWNWVRKRYKKGAIHAITPVLGLNILKPKKH